MYTKSIHLHLNMNYSNQLKDFYLQFLTNIIYNLQVGGYLLNLPLNTTMDKVYLTQIKKKLFLDNELDYLLYNFCR
jgi:hypothetical protein